MTEQLENEFIHLVDQLDSIEDCANSIIERIIDTKKDVLELANVLDKNMGKVKHKVQLVKHGDWSYATVIDGKIYNKCSKCGYLVPFSIPNRFAYCPGCGAKMDGKVK